MEFEFINDSKFKNVLQRDFSEMEICALNKAYKAVLVLAGSIIESILLDYYYNVAPTKGEKDKTLYFDFGKLIDRAHSDKILSQRAKDLSVVIKSYRNLIHPGKEIRENEKADQESASIAISLTKIIINELRDKLLIQNGYAAKDIILKLKTDPYVRPIYTQLLEKINVSERIKLLNELTKYELNGYDDFDDRIDHLPEYVFLMKPFVPNEVLLEYVNQLIAKVGNGSTNEILSLYRLYHNELQFVEATERKIVIIYILHYLTSDIKESLFSEFYRYKMFIDLGTFLDTKESQNLFTDFVRTFIMNLKAGDENFYKIEVLDQMLNSLSADFRLIVDGYIESLPASWKEKYRAIKKENELPF